MPRAEQSPAFQCYPADHLADAAGMTHEEFGMYWRLALHAWRDQGIPTEPARIARILGVNARRLERVWPVVGAAFERRGDVYVLPWQEAERAKQAERREKRKRAAEARWHPDNEPEPEPPEDGYAIAMHMHDNGDAHAVQVECPSSSSASASSTAVVHPSSPSAREADPVAEFLASLPAGERPDWWASEIAAWREGMNLRFPATDEDIASALRDYMRSERREISPPHVRAFVTRATKARRAREAIAEREGNPAAAAQNGAGPVPDGLALFDELLDYVRNHGGYRAMGTEFFAELDPAVRAALSRVGGLKALADADEIGLRIKRKEFAAAHAAALRQSALEAAS